MWLGPEVRFHRTAYDAERAAEHIRDSGMPGADEFAQENVLEPPSASADPLAIEEVKWKKPSKPAGSPVWSHDGILCIGEALKSAVRLTFPKGAHMRDPERLFNTRLDSKTVRAIDFYESETIDDAAVKELILEAVRVNTRRTSG